MYMKSNSTAETSLESYRMMIMLWMLDSTFEGGTLSKYGVGHIVVVLAMDFYEEKLDYVQVYHVTKSRDPLSTNSPSLPPLYVGSLSSGPRGSFQLPNS